MEFRRAERSHEGFDLTQGGLDHLGELFQLRLYGGRIHLARIDLVLDARQQGQRREQILYGPVMDVQDDAAEFFFGDREDAMGELDGSFQGRLPTQGHMRMNDFTMPKE